MTASADVRRMARDYLPFVLVAPLLGVFAFAFDGVYIGATWARDMRNLMVASLAIFFARVVRAALIRQCRAVGRAARALCRARRIAGAALSGAAEGVVCETKGFSPLPACGGDDMLARAIGLVQYSDSWRSLSPERSASTSPRMRAR